MTKRRWVLGVSCGAVLLVLFVLTHGNARHLPRVPFVPRASTGFSGWEDVMARARRVTLVSLDTGAVLVPRPLMLGTSHAASSSYVPEPTPLRVYAHVIRHPEHGDVLVDSGLDASFHDDPYGNIARPGRWIIDALLHAPYTQAAGEDVTSQLARLDAHPRAVFLTHLHMDHTAGLPALSAAEPTLAMITGPHEADDVAGLFGFGHVRDGQRWEELDFTHAPVMAPLGPAIDVFGDGSFWAIATPGHSIGHVSFVVMDRAGPVLLTGDATHFRWAFEHGVGPSGVDEDEAQASLDRLRAFAAAFPEVRVHTGHEGLGSERSAQAAWRESPQRIATSSR